MEKRLDISGRRPTYSCDVKNETMNGKDLALKVIKKYGITDIFNLVQQAGCTIIYEKWHPSTYGEFDKKTKRICVNLNAPLEKERIIAHELGHFFSQSFKNFKSRRAEEQIANEFAEAFFK